MLDLGVAVIGRDDRIVFANRAGAALLRLRRGTRSGGGAIDHEQMTATLDRKIRAALRRGQDDARGHIATVTATSGGRPLFLLARPCGTAGDAMDILFVSQPSQYSFQDLSSVALYYGLTRAETQLLLSLVKGDTLNAYIKHAGITLNTAKGYLKQLFRKTSTGRQSDLVRLILANPILHLVTQDV
jgi:DNA-binding CsgD family transcriptional regulator